MGVENNMPEGWNDTTLGIVSNIFGGYAFKGSDFLKEGTVRVIKIKDIRPPYVDMNNTNFIKIDNYETNKLKKFKLLEKDFVIAMTGATIGKVGLIIDDQEAYLNQRVAKIEEVDSISNKKYLYYQVIQQKFKKFIDNVSSGSSAQQNVSANDIGLFPICLPPLSEQKAIAKVLTAFDDKIELLQAQNKTLETMAQTIFKEWFGKYQIGDELPEGWRVGDIYNVLDVQYGYPFKSKLFNENKEGLPLIRIRDIRKGVTGFYTTESYEEEYIISSGDVLAGMDAIFQPYLWSGGKGLLNQRACRFIPKDFVSRIFVFEFMKPHLSFYEKTKVGTTVIHLGKGDLDFIETVIPDKESLLKFKDLSTPIEEKIINNQQKIQSLSKTRDTLLPKLMSGQVRVKNLKQTADA